MKSLNEVKEIVGLERRAIQEYEKEGLANKPTHKNKYGHLLYDTPEIERLWQLKFYKELGYNITKIKEIQKKGKKAEKEELGNIIEALKEKREKLDNLISIAEMMNETGWSFNNLKNEIIRENDVSAENLFEMLGAVSNIMISEGVKEGIVDDIFSDDEFEKIYSHLESIFEYYENDIDYTDKFVQLEVKNIHKILSKALSGSVYLLRMLVTAFAEDEDMKHEFDEELFKYLIAALTYYCDENKDNSTDKAFVDACNNIERLGRDKYRTDSKEVQNEVNNLYKLINAFEFFSPELRKNFLKKLGELLGSQVYKNVIDGGKQRGMCWFVSRAIEIYFMNMEKENING